mgnify:FL=1
MNCSATARTADSFCGQPFSSRDPRQPDGAFSIRYCVAAALLWREVTPAQFTEECLRDRRLGDLIGRMSLVDDVSSEQAREGQAVVEVVMKDGRVLSAESRGGEGGLGATSLDSEGAKAKFLANASFGGMVAEDSAARAMAAIERLEDLEDVRNLTRLLVKDRPPR